MSFLKAVLPESWRHWLRPARHWRWFEGDFATWAEARKLSVGYDNAAVLDRVVRATREVIAGRATWERDGTTFAELQVNAPLLKVFKDIKALSSGRLNLIDFGGGLGGTWRQHRAVLGGGTGIRWQVVEQPHYVAAGREFADGVLTFHESLDDAQRSEVPRAILLSSVLQYLERPHELLAEMDRRGFEHVIVDRTPLAFDGRERLVVQRTPPELGGGSYPSWFFNRERLLASLGPKFVLRTEWPGFDDLDPAVKFHGFYFQRKKHAGAARGKEQPTALP